MKRFFGSFLVLFFFACGAWGSPAQNAILELERSTSFHWGQDCLVWVVHYSPNVVAPWVESEAQKANFNDIQKEEYRKAFVSELRMDEAEPFLVSIYAFSAYPIELKPFEEKISLVNSRGQRIKPISYERVFEDPIQGMVQGLVFFPKQPDEKFAIAFKGLGVFPERMFQFSGETIKVAESPAGSSMREELVVIDMPARPEPVKQPPPPPPPPAIEEKPKPRTEPTPEPITPPVVDNANAYVSKERALQTFLNSWMANDITAMYGMLSPDSKKMYSREAFDKEVKKLADIRRGMLSSYKIDWLGEERAKISTTKKLLIMRTLISKTLGVVRMGNEWRVVW